MTPTSPIIISEDEFIQTYRPMPNVLDANASFDFGDGGCLYETFGPELEHIRSQLPEHVWTIIETDGELAIVSGYHFVNRLGYILTAVQWLPGEDVYVDLEQL